VLNEHESPKDGKQNFMSAESAEHAVKFARVVGESPEGFGLEYDNTLGQKNVMRLDAFTYEQAIREAKSILEIDSEGRDVHGATWDIE
jgi:hypothetical protein